MFRRIIRALSKRWVLALIGVLAISLLVWFVGPLIAVAEYKPLEAEGVRFGTVLVLLIAWGLNNLRVRAAERKAEQQLAEEVAADAATPARSDSPEADAEQAVLAQRLKEALRTLQTAGLAKGRKLYQLPWYVVIGAPGSGKTTALKNSGLRFPLQSQFGDNPIQGAGGTRYCDWWFTDEAVFIDTAGRYTTQDNPKQNEGRSWLGFLGMLKKSRPKRPLNGIIITISLLDLLNRTPTQQAIHATAIKRRIQELNGHLGMELPVYVLFTKCDLVAGFGEFFADLDAEDREQVWGVSLPLAKTDRATAALEAFPERYVELLARANDRVLKRLQDERDPRRRAMAFQFPRQMLGLKDRLQGFLKDVFVPNQFEQPALLRGVYFVSGTQTAAPGQWVEGVLPASMCAAPVGSGAGTAPRSFFLQRLLRQVIFAESGLAAADSRAERRFRWSYSGALAAVVMLFIGSVGAWTVSHQGNSGYMDQVRAQVDEYRKHTGGGLSARQRDWLVLAAGLNQLKGLPTGYEQGTEPRTLAVEFGLYQGEKVGAQAGATYLNALERYFLPAVTDRLLRLVQDAHNNEDYLYEALRFYLMLYHPERMDREAFELWARLMWERGLPGEQNEPVRIALMEHLRVALDEHLPPPAQNAHAVAEAREVLSKTPLERRLYRRLKNEYLQEHKGQFTVAGVLGSKAELLFERRSGKSLTEGIPKLFTYKGFHTGFNVQSKQMAKRLADESWIYGDSGPETLSGDQIELITERVHEFYFNEYIARWEAFLSDLTVASFATTSRGQGVLRMLASVDAPVVKLLGEVRKHTALSELPAGSKSAAKVADAVTDQTMANEKRRLERLMPESGEGVGVRLPGQPVANAFAELNAYAVSAEGMPLHRLQQSFVKLNEYLDALAYSNDVRRAAFQATRDPERSGGALTEVRRSLAQAPKLVQGWFGGLSRDTGRITSVAARGYLNDVWNAEVVSFYERAIAGRYPVDPNSRQEIRLRDFAAFFGPGGVLDKYFQDYVEPFVAVGRSGWRWRKPVGMSNQTLVFFQRAQRIRDMYFPEGKQPRVGFKLRPRRLDKAAIRVLLGTGGEEFTYQHGPMRFHSLQWPGAESGSARVVFNLASRGTPLSAQAEGDWGWFRLLDRHGRIEEQGNGYLITLDVQGIDAEFELRPDSVLHPFGSQEVRGFALPQRL